MVPEYIHSTYIKKQNNNFVIVKLREDNKNSFKIHQNIKRKIYITKEHLRYSGDDVDRKEWEDINNLNEYVVNEDNFLEDVYRALYNRYPDFPLRKYNLLSHIDLYGANMSAETLIKHKYNERLKQNNQIKSPITTGFFDTETSMIERLGKDRLIAASLTHENQVYSYIIEDFFYIKKDGLWIKGNIEDLEKLRAQVINEDVFISKKAKELYKEKNIQYHYKIVKDEMDLIRCFMEQIHKNETDFIGIWNLPFDINAIVKTCEKFHVDPKDIFTHPSLKDFKNFYFHKEDSAHNNKHFSERWSYVSSPSYTKFVDSLCLYAILRIVKGKEVSYKLDYILEKNEISEGKLKFSHIESLDNLLGSADWHRKMQDEHPYEYIIYNIFDSLSLQILEWINNDINTMNILLEDSLIQHLNKQTIRNKDAFYFKCLEIGKVISSAPPKPLDYPLVKAGGAVADPGNTFEIGRSDIIEEFKDHPTQITVFNSDIDLSQAYPTTIIQLNISRETKRKSIKNIEGYTDDEVFSMFSDLSGLKENSVKLCNREFNLPSYSEISDLIDQELMRGG